MKKSESVVKTYCESLVKYLMKDSGGKCNTCSQIFKT